MKEKPFYWCRKANIGMQILKNIFNFQSSSHNICFLAMFANSSLGHNVDLGPVQRLFCSVLTFQRFEAYNVQGNSSEWLLWLCFKVATFLLF